MRMCIVFCTLWLAGFALGDSKDYKIFCFFTNWARYRSGIGSYEITDIDPTQCTHLVYAFIGITEDGDVKVLDKSDLADGGGETGFKNFIALRKSSPSTKFMVSMGGWNEGTRTYSNVMANTTLRSNLVKNVVNFTLHYDFDGFDMDWEYPGQRDGVPADVENFVLLLKELRAVFDEHDLILSTSVGAPEFCAKQSYNVPEISKHVHFIICMTFEYHDYFDPITGHSAPLYPAKRESTEYELSLNVDSSIKYWLDQGAAPEKLILATAFYGKSFTLNNSIAHELGSPITAAGEAGEYTGERGFLSYYEICERVQNKCWTSIWDEEQRVPYAYLGDQWVSYDNVKSITEKGNYIKEHGLGGVMIWTLDTDDFRGICGEPNPLLKALNAALEKSNAADRGASYFAIFLTSVFVLLSCFLWC